MNLQFGSVDFGLISLAAVAVELTSIFLALMLFSRVVKIREERVSELSKKVLSR